MGFWQALIRCLPGLLCPGHITLNPQLTYLPQESKTGFYKPHHMYFSFHFLGIYPYCLTPPSRLCQNDLCKTCRACQALRTSQQNRAFRASGWDHSCCRPFSCAARAAYPGLIPASCLVLCLQAPACFPSWVFSPGKYLYSNKDRENCHPNWDVGKVSPSTRQGCLLLPLCLGFYRRSRAVPENEKVSRSQGEMKLSFF